MKKNAALQIIALALAFILVAGVIVGVIFWQNGNISFTPVGQEQTGTPDDDEQNEELPVLDDEGEEMESGVVHAMPKAMTFRTAASLAATPATQAETYDSVTLTATVKPDSAADKSVDWEIAFVNPSSEWATGKTVTDYVTVTPQSDGSTTATVRCLQPFGEQIKITVTSRMNTEATASCTVDFSARPKVLIAGGIDFLAPVGMFFGEDDAIVTAVPLTANSSYLTTGGKYMQSKNVDVAVMTLTDYTVGEVVINDFEIDGKPSSGLVTTLKAQGFTPRTDYKSLFITPPEGEGFTCTLISCLNACGISTSADGSTNVATVNKLNTAIQANMSEYDFEVRLTVETNVGTFEYINQYKFDRSSSVFGVESIQLSNSNVVI